MLTRVGDEHMGRFIRETLAAEGVDTSHVATDPERLTALVILGIRDRETFPLIFYRENCADMALSPDDVDPAWIATTKALVVSGTHFSTPGVRCRQPRRDGGGQGRGDEGRARHRLPPGPVGPDRTRARGGAVRRRPGRDGAPPDHRPGLAT